LILIRLPLRWFSLQDPEDSTGTAIRRQVSDCWPAIVARLQALTREIQASRGTSLVILRQHNISPSHQTLDVSTRRVYLSKLLELITVMTECSGDFIASRFKNDVFPEIAKLLNSFVGDYSKVEALDDTPSYETAGAFRDVQTLKGATRQQSETSLIIAMLLCFAGVFRTRVCGQSLAGLITTAGTLILPYLGDPGEVGVACQEAIEQMIQIDCDALWRPLLQLSGSPFPPPRPWKAAPLGLRSMTIQQDKSVPTQCLQRRAKELVAFIESLPEQSFC
jgi:hypothetical protein